MKIFHAHCLHTGEWESYWQQALKELKEEGRIVNKFANYHNGAWTWTQVLRELGHKVVEFDYRTTHLIKKKTLIKHPFLYGLYGDTKKREVPILTRLDHKIMNKRLLKQLKKTKPDMFITYPGEMIYPKTIKEMQRALNILTVLWLGRDPVVEGTPNVVESFP